MRFFSASIRLVFLYICDVREHYASRIISLPQIFVFFSFYRLLCIVFNLQRTKATKTRYFFAKVLFVFLPFWKWRHRFTCVTSQTSFFMHYFSASISFIFFIICNIRQLLKRVIFLQKFSSYSYLIEDSDIVSYVLFLCPNSFCIFFLFAT